MFCQVHPPLGSIAESSAAAANAGHICGKCDWRTKKRGRGGKGVKSADLRLSLLEVSVPWQWQEAHTPLVSSLQKERKKRRQQQPQPKQGASSDGSGGDGQRLIIFNFNLK